MSRVFWSGPGMPGMAMPGIGIAPGSFGMVGESLGESNAVIPSSYHLTRHIKHSASGDAGGCERDSSRKGQAMYRFTHICRVEPAIDCSCACTFRRCMTCMNELSKPDEGTGGHSDQQTLDRSNVDVWITAFGGHSRACLNGPAHRINEISGQLNLMRPTQGSAWLRGRCRHDS